MLRPMIKERKMSLTIYLLIFLINNVHMKILRKACKYDGDFSIALEGIIDSGSLLNALSGKSKRSCLLICKSTLPCESVNYKQDGGICQLLDRNLTASRSTLQSQPGWVFISTNEYSLAVRIIHILR